MRSLPSILLGTALLCASSPSLGQVAVKGADVSDEANRSRQLFEKGVDAIKAGKFEEARRVLLESWGLRKSYDTAGVLGQAELELGRYRDAAEHLDYCIRDFAPGEHRELLKQVESALVEAKKHVATVRLSANRTGAQLIADDTLIGTVPIAFDIFLDPGKHILSAQLDEETGKREVWLEPGKEYSFTVELRPGGRSESGTPVGPGTAPQRDTVVDEQKPSLVPLYLGGGLVLAGLAVGIGFRLAADGNDDAFGSLGKRLTPSACDNPGVQAADCATARAEARAYDRNVVISTIGFTTAGAAALLVGGYYGYYEWFKPKQAKGNRQPATSTRLSGAFGVHGGNLAVSGSF